jgi:hypothetical protein
MGRNSCELYLWADIIVNFWVVFMGGNNFELYLWIEINLSCIKLPVQGGNIDCQYLGIKLPSICNLYIKENKTIVFFWHFPMLRTGKIAKKQRFFGIFSQYEARKKKLGKSLTFILRHEAPQNVFGNFFDLKPHPTNLSTFWRGLNLKIPPSP